MARLRNGWKRLFRRWKAARRDGNCRWICRPRRFSVVCGRSCRRFRAERRGPTARSRERLENRERYGRWREPVPRILFQLWCRATEWYARTGILPGIDGDFRGKKRCWSGSGRKQESGTEEEKRKRKTKEKKQKGR